MEGQTTGILEEKLKLEAEVGTLREQLEKRGNEVKDFILLSLLDILCQKKKKILLMLGRGGIWPSKGV